MKNMQRGFTLVKMVSVVWIAFILAIAVGWVFNIMALLPATQMGLNEISLMTILRIVGIFVPPLGAILGYFF